MNARSARWISRSVLALCIAALVGSVPIFLGSRDDPRPATIYVVGDPTAERVDEVRRSLMEEGPPDFTGGDPGVPGIGALVLLCLLWVGTGTLIVSRQPKNWAGWIFVTVGAPLPLLTLIQALIRYGVRIDPGAVPLLGVWAVLGEFMLYPVVLVPLLFLLYPDGRPPSPRWRWAVRGLLGGTALAFLGFAIRPGPLNNWVELGVLYVNPIGIDGLGRVSGAVIAFGAIVALLAAGSTVIAVVQRFRRSTGEERQQMRWLASVAAIAGAAFAAMFLAVPVTQLLGVSDEESDLFNWLFGITAFTLVLGLPAAYVIAIFRYHLYDLDVVIKKTVQFAVLLALFLVLGFAVVAVVPTLLVGVPSDTDTVPVLVLSALLSGAFLWLRPRAARLANRIVYGRRATPYEVLSEFSERVGETYSIEDVLPRMAQLVGEATGARRADVWLKVGSSLRPEAKWPRDAVPLAPRMLRGDASPSETGNHAAEVRHQGELLGAITLEPSPDDPIDAPKDALVRDVAAQAGLVLRNVRLIEDLRASRQRLVAAQDEERRKLERNIHDGVQQQLVALNVQLGLLAKTAHRDPERAAELATELQGRATATLEDLRDLARGIYPPLLADRGLTAAIEAQAGRAAVPTTVASEGIGRYQQDVESAVYFCVLEAMNNTAKYADASTMRISLAHRNGSLEFVVADDGRGFEMQTARGGTGLQGMADRIEAIGGTFDVESEPGRGTEVRGSVPAA